MNGIKTGILSFGMSGQIFHAPFLAAHEGFELYAVVERSKKNAQSIYSSVKSYDKVDELIADDTVELVVVNTPNATHFEFARRALRAKKHVLVEKPFTITSGEAQQLYQEAKKNNVQVFPYHNRRYDSDFQSVKSVLNAGKLGDLVEAHIRFDRYKHDIGEKKAKETPGPGAGLLYDLGPHILDQAISLFGIPETWQKSVRHFRPKTQVDDYASIHLSYPNGLQVFLTGSLLVADPLPSFVVHGTLGSYIKKRTDVQEKQLSEGMHPGDTGYGVEPDVDQGMLTIISASGEKLQEHISSAASSYMQVFDDVFQAIRGGKPYPVKEEEIIQQLQILEG
ncbi:Predicted dehydrogenase [Reichenbachiella faecimaris]|uniref:Predicted dehydrogenase n=1 Tax=Reichenbachiella faecimaris TaxID=692418 RepID=A0A1W2G874_REIFA|nr:Gfo/Idh/MocA family oxidoreductase [Reichenbachiella faecimaris]SMD32885.1 Predicted dehydrogenase [Reichenbachiella faecimaris]